MKSSLKLTIATILLLAAATAGGYYLWPRGVDPDRAALAEYDIERMTCGSCIAKIQTALQDTQGVGDVAINLTRHTGRVVYDPQSTNPAAIARAISATGYPATLRNELTMAEYEALRQDETRLARKYVARVGDRLLPRSEFEALVNQRSGTADLSDAQLNGLWQTTWNDLLQRELLLLAAEQNGIVVQQVEVDARLDEIRQRHAGFDELVSERYGSLAEFADRLQEDMIIERNLEQVVLAGIDDRQLRNVTLQNWYAKLSKETEVVIFEPRLKAVNQGGCGGGCCG